MTTLTRFFAEIDAFTEEDIPREIGILARLVSIAALNKVVLKSPVDTGRFRGAWMVTIGQTTEVNPPAPPTDKKGRKARAAGSASAAINAGVGVIGGAKPFDTIFIQNNVEYGEELESGTSTQAPQGMLAVTVAELENTFK